MWSLQDVGSDELASFAGSVALGQYSISLSPSFLSCPCAETRYLCEWGLGEAAWWSECCGEDRGSIFICAPAHSKCSVKSVKMENWSNEVM